MISRFLAGFAPPRAAVRMVYALVAVLGTISCNDAAGPGRAEGGIRIIPVADSAFEGDTVHLAAQVLDGAGAEVPGPVTWMVSDPTLAQVVGQDSLALLRPGVVRITARSGTATATSDLAIARLVAQQVEVTPDAVTMGRTDHLVLTARALGQGGRVISGRAFTFTSGNTMVATVPGPATYGSTDTELVLAVGPGSSTIQAELDGVVGTAQIEVVLADTTLALTDYNGSPLPILVAAGSTEVDGVEEYDELYIDTGTLVLSGLLQERYKLEVLFSLYRVTRTGNTVRRELRLQTLGEHDAGVVTTAADGSLTMLSELIGPHLEHTAARLTDGYLVHYRIAGTSSYLDLTYRRTMP